MQPTETAPATPTITPRHTLRLAWLTLLGFFIVFLALIAWAGVTVRDVFQSATVGQGATLFVRGPAEAISWRPADRTIYQGARDQQPLAEGDSVRVAAAAGYGQVASLRLFEESQLDLWASAEVTLAHMRTSRWHSDTLDVAVRQHAGYVRYDIKPNLPYQRQSYQVQIGDAMVALTPGGSYSIEMRPDRLVQRPDGGNAQVADVAVRSGYATVYGADGSAMAVRAGERVAIDPAGSPGLAVPARWELVRDGGFSRFSEKEYNNTTSADPTAPRSDSWQVFGTPELPPENRGFFRLSPICRPPHVGDSYCSPEDRRTAAWFYRANQQVSGFTTGIQQDLGPGGAGVDISEYRSLKLALWARVLHQALADVGDRGSECPVMIRLLAKRDGPASPEEERVICVYHDADGIPPGITEPGVKYIPVNLAEWTPLSFELRDPEWLPDYRYLRSIQIYANGHDYDSRVAEVSIVGEQ